MNNRLMIAAMKLALVDTTHQWSEEAYAPPRGVGKFQWALNEADALLAAAGEPFPVKTGCDDCRERAEASESKLAACERERDALNAEVWVHHPAVRAEYEAEIAALKRRLEPLTLQEGGGVNNPIIYGSRPLAWDEITAIVADADRIRSRRQP